MWVALGAAIALSGCANVDVDSEQAWFAKRFDLTGRNAGYTFSELQESKQRQKPITANDLVSSSGACPAPVAAAPQAAVAGPGVQPTIPAAAPADDLLLGSGIALGMSECEVVARAGAPSAVQIGKTPGGDRATVLTFNGGPRAGVYRFERGALTEMDRVAVAAPPQDVAKKKPAKPSKSAKSAKPQKKNES